MLMETVQGGVVNVQRSSDTLGGHVDIQHPDIAILLSKSRPEIFVRADKFLWFAAFYAGRVCVSHVKRKEHKMHCEYDFMTHFRFVLLALLTRIGSRCT